MQQNAWLEGRTMLRLLAMAVPAVGLMIAVGCGGSSSSNTGGLPGGRATQAQVAQGRYLVLASGCASCHNRDIDDPSDPQWLAGYTTGSTQGKFAIGPFTTYAANLTPDTTTGLGGVTDRQVFNALRYGLDPMNTPDVTITSTTPGQGNFPATPHYLGAPMPWPSFRHFSDADLWAIVAYIKHGITAVKNQVPDGTEPPDFWASSYTASAIGPAAIPAYPASNEKFAP